MIINKNIESVYLNETSIIDLLLLILSENSEYTSYIQSVAEIIADREEKIINVGE